MRLVYIHVGISSSDIAQNTTVGAMVIMGR